jgi:hypothetical protein
MHREVYRYWGGPLPGGVLQTCRGGMRPPGNGENLGRGRGRKRERGRRKGCPRRSRRDRERLSATRRAGARPEARTLRRGGARLLTAAAFLRRPAALNAARAGSRRSRRAHRRHMELGKTRQQNGSKASAQTRDSGGAAHWAGGYLDSFLCRERRCRPSNRAAWVMLPWHSASTIWMCSHSTRASDGTLVPAASGGVPSCWIEV